MIEDDTKGCCCCQQICIVLIENEVKMCPDCNEIYCQPCIDRLPKAQCSAGPKCQKRRPK